MKKEQSRGERERGNQGGKEREKGKNKRTRDVEKEGDE